MIHSYPSPTDFVADSFSCDEMECLLVIESSLLKFEYHVFTSSVCKFRNHGLDCSVGVSYGIKIVFIPTWTCVL